MGEKNTKNIDWVTVEFVFKKISECTESGGILNWSKVGDVIEQARENQKITKKHNRISEETDQI